MIVAAIRFNNGVTATLDDRKGWASDLPLAANVLNTTYPLEGTDMVDGLLPAGMGPANRAARALGCELEWTGPTPAPLPPDVVS